MQRRKKRTGISIFLCIIAILAAYLAFSWYENSRYQYFLETPIDPTNTDNVSVVIRQGETSKDIASTLKEKDLIPNEKAFEKYVRSNGLDQNLYAGRYLLNQSMTIPEIAEKLSNKTSGEVIVTIPEGYTISQIDEKLTSLGLIEEGNFIKATKNFDNYEKYSFLDKEKIEKLPYPLEGFLFPDTYYVSAADFSSKNFLSRLLNTFEKKVLPEFETADAQRTSLEIMTMASILEHEVNKNEDRPIVAGILWKRLDEGWQLGADATLLYLKKDRNIDYEDIKDSSPYNTRKFTGLPPGPIGNPGLKSILATLHPETSPYYYYLHRADNGEIIYAKTNEEHNRNREKYL